MDMLLLKMILLVHISCRRIANLHRRCFKYFFPKEKDFPQRELIPGSTNSLYNQIQYDSEVEKNFIINRLQEDDRNGQIICYFKFPANFKIRIPKIIGNYNPDWGLIRYDSDGITKSPISSRNKGSMNPNLLQFPNEKRKIDCAKSTSMQLE